MAAGMPSAAAAFELGGSVGWSSGNLYRGLPLGDGPVLLADVHAAAGTAWSGGVAVGRMHSRVSGPGTQLTLYLDRHWQLDADWSAKIGLVHYDWPGDRWRDELRYDEIDATLAHRDSWTVTFALSPNSTVAYVRPGSTGHGNAAWLETAWRQPIAGGVVADFGVGYAARSAAGGRDYAYASAGLSCAVSDGYLIVGRTWTSRTEQAYWWEGYEKPRASARWMASLLWTF